MAAKPKAPFTSLSFAGCGGMYTYCLGFACYMQENFDMSDVTVYATSGGTISALLLTSGLSIRDFQTSCNVPGIQECQQTWLGAAFNGFAIASRWLLNWLPDDAYQRAAGRLFLSVTRVPKWRNELLREFSSNEECVRAMKCSSFIPWVFELAPACEYRGAWYIDGGLSNNQPVKDADTFRVYFYRWRRCKPHWVWPFSDPAWTATIFEWGFQDARKHFEG
eukprot:GGOE01004887.1.p1 GENE.GGOE01004887.1~~GGOE01004887.1.p1  ORF type:complete len:258 (+),score=47.85 GGOE01004887.1:113-775(+)